MLVFMKKFLTIAAIVLAGALYASADANALKVSPTILELSANPGGAAVQTIKLTNDQSAPLTLSPTIYDVEPGDNEDGLVKLSALSKESTLPNWIRLSDSSVTLAPNETKDVMVSIAVPADAPPGGHYALVSFGTDSTENPEMGAAVTGQVGINMVMDIKGQAVEKGDVITFEAEGQVSKFEKLPITFVTRVANTGNRHFKPRGTIAIQDMFGRTVATLPVNAVRAGGNVLPKSVREFKTTWSEGFAFGKYTAVLDATMGKAGAATALYTFWVLPTGLLVLWLIIALVILIILILLVKNMLMALRKT
jgi:hypothetical protein